MDFMTSGLTLSMQSCLLGLLYFFLFPGGGGGWEMLLLRLPPQDGLGVCVSTCGSPLIGSCNLGDALQNVPQETGNFLPSTLQCSRLYSQCLLQHLQLCRCHRNFCTIYSSGGSLLIHSPCTLDSCLFHSRWWGLDFS